MLVAISSLVRAHVSAGTAGTMRLTRLVSATSVCRKSLGIWLAAVLVSAVQVPAFAAASLMVTVIDGEAGGTEVVLMAPDGTSRTVKDKDRDGLLVLPFEGGPGDYEVLIRCAGQLGRATVSAPASGQVSMLFNPHSPGEGPSVTYVGGNEKIVVTARKREEDLQTTPVSVTAFPVEALEERSMDDVSDLAEYTPNLEFATTGPVGGSSSVATVYIRGIGQISETIYSDPGVGIYVDGVYLARSQGAVFDLLDLVQVEVLRGPQGTLFGKNTMGGAINLVTRTPSDGFGGDFRLGVGSYGRREGRFRINVPMGKRTYALLALSSVASDGVTKSLTTGESYYDDNRDSGRLALRFLPSESWSINFTTDYSREREHAVDATLLAVNESIPILDFYNTVRRFGGYSAYDSSWITGDLLRSYSNDPNFSNSDVSGTSLRISATVRGLTLRSITAYREVKQDVSNDFDGSPLRYAFPASLTQQKQWSEELQVLGLSLEDRLNWVLGALYFDEASRGRSHAELFGGLFEALESAPGAIFAPPPFQPLLCLNGSPMPGFPCLGGAGNPLNLAFRIDEEKLETRNPTTQSSAVFGEGTLELTDGFSVTAGLRYTYEEKDFLYRIIPGPSSSATPLTVYNKDRWEAVTSRFSLGYQAKPNSFLYASISSGFKSGGFNGLPSVGNKGLLEPYAPERVWTYELGFKTDRMQNRLRLNAAFFWNDYSDLQLLASLIADGEPLFVIENAGKAEVKGFEIELLAQPLRSFLLSLGVGHVEAGYTELDRRVQAVTLGGTIPKTPEWSVIFSPQYTYYGAGGSAFIMRTDYSYKTKYYNDVTNNEIIAQKAFGLWNVRVSYITSSGRWETALWAKNLANERYLEHGTVAEAFGPALGVPGRPREWGLSVQYRF